MYAYALYLISTKYPSSTACRRNRMRIEATTCLLVLFFLCYYFQIISLLLGVVFMISFIFITKDDDKRHNNGDSPRITEMPSLTKEDEKNINEHLNGNKTILKKPKK